MIRFFHVPLMAILFLCTSMFLFTTSSFASVTGQFDEQIEKSGVEKKHLGIYISLGEKSLRKKIYANNEIKNFIPASLSKIITAGAALAELRPGTTFKTQLATTAPVQNNVLKGDLYLIGQGDPGFVSESMWNLVNHFSRNRIHIIEGNLVVDDSWFDNVRQDPSREDSDIDRAYNSPIGAMSFNWNSVNVYIRPGKKKGDLPQVFVDPENNYIRVINNAKTVNSNQKVTVQARRVKNPDKTFSGNTIRVTGNMPLNANEKVIYRSITHPDLWSGYNLRAFLERRGIEVMGEVKVGTLKTSTKVVLAEVESHSVEKMVKDMMKFSNNYVAEMLTKQIAAKNSQQPGSILEGMKHIRQFVLDSGIESGIDIYNPSGLTRRNQFQPKALHDFLVALRGHFDIFAENLSSYPLAGIDGTLEKRMRGTLAEGWVRAKTGMLSGVIGLAGFAGRRDGQTYNFVFLYNGPAAKVYQARDLFDKMAVTLASESIAFEKTSGSSE